MVNIVFGKTIESLGERDTVRICRSKKEYLIEVSKPTLKREIIVNPEMVIVTHKRQTVFYNKPFYVGFSILDLSKLIMFSWYYEVLKKFYDKPHQVRSIYSDTDSYVLSILTIRRCGRFQGANAEKVRNCQLLHAHIEVAAGCLSLARSHKHV